MESGRWKLKNPYSDSAWKMGIDMNLKESSKLQLGSGAIKEAAFPKQVKSAGKHHDKLKGKSCSGGQYSGPPRELRQSASSGCRHQESDKPTKTVRDDELVRYMSNLPGYLQHLETGDQMQNKVTNVGVLDRSRLERWKGDRTCGINQEEIYCQTKPHTAVWADRNLSSYCNDDASLQTPSKIRLEMEKELPMAYKSFDNVERILEKGKIDDLGQSTSSTGAKYLSNSRYEYTPTKRTEYPSAWDDDDAFKRDGAHSHTCNQKITLIAGASSSKLSSSKDTRNVVGVTKKTREVFLESSNGLASGHQPVDNRNIVLLVPGKVPKVGFLLGEPHASLCRTFEESDPSSCSGRFANTELHYPPCLPADEMADSDSRKGRHASPNRRFSFSLSQMTRSFSVKETSSVPQLSATYVPRRSGPVTSQAFFCSEDSKKDTANVHTKARASPLRRILDPLLKSRGSTTLHSSRTNPPSKSNLDSLDTTQFLSTKSPRVEVNGKSIVQGRLLLTMKNGHPLFRLEVENDRNVLAATNTAAATPGKHDSGCSYTIYAIEEIKKKSGGWMNQSSKEKSCGIVHNVVGHMKINTDSSDDFPQNSCTNQLRVRESVLFGVDLKQSDQVSPHRELAAVVITMDDGTESLHEMEYLTKSFFQIPSKSSRWHCNLPRKDHCNSTTVILPGAVHGLPNKGDLSPLIERWRSGGLCDCGGWDVGCKLCVLSNESHNLQCSKISDYFQTSDHLELFLQGEDRIHEPVFSLRPLEKGEYSVTFSSSISLLQAFFICVTVISCQASSDLAEARNLFEDRVRREFSAENEREKTIRASTPGRAASKHAACPPISPVSRV